MQLSFIDIAIVLAYILGTLAVGFWVSKKASKNMRSYFLGGNSLSWRMLGLSNASGMFDISGTMWLVYLLFIYGLSSVYIPWLWPVFNQIFMMVFLSAWLRRSGVLTGAEFITFRFGNSLGARLSHLVVVVFALINVVAFIAYGFIGIGKFAAVFLPWQFSADPYWNDVAYALIITAITTLYVVKGGMMSVVFTEVFQFVVMTLASIAVGIIAMQQVSPELLATILPDGWSSVAVHWQLNIDWAERLPAANEKILQDGYNLFTIFFMLVLLKGVLVSLAGPAPNYDMQRVLSTKSPSDASKMSWFVNVVLFIPRYMMIAGLTVLALVFFTDDLRAMGSAVDFEQILPMALKEFIPVGLKGLLIAGLLAAFMGTFAATVNAAPAYVVNDIYKRYINPNADAKKYVHLSYLFSVIFVILGVIVGLFIPSLNNAIQWIVAALYGGYTASNMLKWLWWRFNGMGYFWGMVVGIVAAITLAFTSYNPLYSFPFLFLLCLVTCVIASLVTRADDMEVLKAFYIKVRPWGFWTPVREQVQQDYPAVQKNPHFVRDMFNVLVGIIWQTSMVALPIFLVIQHWSELLVSLVVLLVTSGLLWKFWWKNLEDYPADTPRHYLPGTAGEVETRG
ncbi:sodium:solute symporter family protein [Cellvibrio japonicus]|uniref:Na+/glucose symporter n=1 Tax=Cellvibrio japonicus (strain Ueda107) TaxID=498211 RepID=B3PGI6_CELJU|nr:sodium:solute symporter family protein [Cellvibrio japonicus]ACE83591.1 Na+/glucose symporter [Cellvibrio japonicus Ueda107]QEI10971.1 Na+:solute symporter [Cellvibrio japonicus]QEI14547.1 Na+:solute symporter [Cellvibrio japonicus]QEI18125.1 Na+:solute symporter [Cellvibrio japonicus]